MEPPQSAGNRNASVPFLRDDVCGDQQLEIRSKGIWDLGSAESFLHYELPLLHLQLSVIFLLTYCLHFFLKRLRFPRIISEILAGIILGPSCLGRMKEFSDTLFPEESKLILTTLSKVGYLFFMFLIGVKMDISMIKKSGRIAWAIGTLSLLIPLVTVIPISSTLIRTMKPDKKEAMTVVAVTQSLIPFPVIACLLIELKILNSELGRLALSSAVISDLLGIFLITMATYVRAAIESSLIVGLKSMLSTAYLLYAIIFVMRSVMYWIISRTPEGKAVKEVYTIFIVLAVLISAILSDYIGLQYLFGPFVFGLVVPDGPPLGSTLVARLDTFVSGFLVPLLLSYCGLKTNFFAIFAASTVSVLCAINFLILVGKVAASLIPALYCKMPLKDAVALALIMSTKGIVEVGTFVSFMDNKSVDEEIFALVTFTVLITAAIVPRLVRCLYDPSRKYAGYQKRNVLHFPNNGELRILTCVFRQDDALASVKLLEVSGSKESPISVYALHVVELIGRSSPLVIDHRLGQKSSSPTGSRSQHIIEVFNYYRHQNRGSTTVQVFTAISLPKLMYDDICALAFDKLASLILLPFHRKFGANGKLILDNKALRTQNCFILDKAPCSVGILVDRRKIRGPSSILSMTSLFRVAVLFLGGDDDREALAYAKRMAKNSRVHLTLVRFVSSNEDSYDKNQNGWDRMLDLEVLKDMKFDSGQMGDVIYREEMVKDGSDTAMIIKSMEGKYDLIMVGRRHDRDSQLTSGLTEWSELPELGPVGDMLASSDIRSPVSVLVVQQQHMQCKK